MRVDEAWAYYLAIGLDDTTSLHLVKLANGGNSITTNANVSVVPWAPGTIYDTTPLDN